MPFPDAACRLLPALLVVLSPSALAMPLVCTPSDAPAPAYRLLVDGSGDSMGNAIQRSEYRLVERGSGRALLRCRLPVQAGRLDCAAPVAGGVDARFTLDRASGRYTLERAGAGGLEQGRCGRS